MAQSLAEKDSAGPSRKNQVLVIDDDISVLDSFVRVLERAGFKADTAQTGEEAIAKIGVKDYDVVLFDFRLPDINGLQVAMRMKDRLRNAVKIMITGYPTIETREQALKEGIYAYTAKPVQPTELILYIAQMLKEKSLKEKT